MSVNSSSSSNDSLLDRPHSYSFSDTYCLTSSPGSFILVVLKITCIPVLLPLCTFILHHGFQQWWQKRSTSSAVTASHSDIITYHMVTMELIRVCGWALASYGSLMKDLNTVKKGGFLFDFTWMGETFFHNLTCVERYLAVVHPVTYRNLKTERGIRIRNISIACVWLLCCVRICLNDKTDNSDLCILILSLLVVTFCSLSVLCALIRPVPGGRGGNQERVDQSKLRAFYTITVILGVLVLRCACGLVWTIGVKILLREGGSCAILAFYVLVNLLSSLVLPLLFLQRAGKLECCRKNIQRE